jgi:endonuclease YncB( thermonuclease family)
MLAGVTLLAVLPAHGGGTRWSSSSPRARADAQSTRTAVAPSAPKPQPRPSGSRVAIDPQKVRIDDGDTVVIAWGANDEETVRVLGIDCPETRHPQHDIPYGQAFGEEARAFAMGAFGSAAKIELLRASMLDPYGRTLGYLFVNGKNYSVLVIQARLAEESVTRYGDNGFPAEAATVTAAAKEAGPLPFESPGEYRVRMKGVTQWMKAHGVYPAQ